MPIHPTAIIDRKAELDGTVEVGPYAMVDGPVKVGARTKIGPHAHLSGNTTIGTDNQIHIGAVIGYLPQDLKYKECDSGLVIGSRNTFREYVTIHRATEPGTMTRIGDETFLMANAHVAHNCVIGNRVVICNGALVAGHVHVDEDAFISGNALIHQFVHLGKRSMMSGGGGVSMDVPPYIIAGERNECLGLNLVGLKRSGCGKEAVLEMRDLFKLFYRSGLNVTNALKAIRARKFKSKEAAEFVAFVEGATRGVVPYLRGSGDDE